MKLNKVYVSGQYTEDKVKKIEGNYKWQKLKQWQMYCNWFWQHLATKQMPLKHTVKVVQLALFLTHNQEFWVWIPGETGYHVSFHLMPLFTYQEIGTQELVNCCRVAFLGMHEQW